MRLLMAIVCSSLIAAQTATATDNITYFRDGTVIQQSASTKKGYIEIPLAPGFIEKSLTVSPTGKTSIRAIEIIQTESSAVLDKEIDALTEQRRRLEDRLQALDTKEAIFTAAAKSQSGKAPRKSKTNPDPMQTIRQGTEFAIAQLEAVYTARRKTNLELRRTDSALAVAKKKTPAASGTIRITVVPQNGSVTIRYATNERGWLPGYILHLDDNSSQLELVVKNNMKFRNFQTKLSPASISDANRAVAVSSKNSGTSLAWYPVKVTELKTGDSIINNFTAIMTNSGNDYLPGGETILLKNGVYIGKFSFKGLSSARSSRLEPGFL